METASTVYIVDDDDAVRESLEAMLGSVGLKVITFSSAIEFLERERRSHPACLVVDVRMPQMSGLELVDRLAERDDPIPAIFISGHGDVATAVRAMRSGALDFLEKPYSHKDLLDRVHQALALDASRQTRGTAVATIETRMERLTRREDEVMRHVVGGLSNKQIAAELGIHLKTVESHRAKIMSKMEADSVAALVRMVMTAEAGSATRDRELLSRER